MSAISGYWRTGEGPSPAKACAQMASAQRVYGPHDRSVRSLASVAFGRNLYRLVPEDIFDHQPLLGAGGRYLLTADVRIDNRAELSAKLGIERAAEVCISDADLLLAAWEHWNEAALKQVIGDFALAVWDTDERTLMLARSPLSMKPLHYHIGRDFVAFASMPSGLHALESIPQALNFGHAAAIAAGVPPLDSSTIFETVSRVEHGHVVHFDGGHARSRRYFEITRAELRFPKRSDYADALRDKLEQAVNAQLRHFDGRVACHLSAGRDSSAVAATAARLLQLNGERLPVYTAAPRLGFPGLTLPKKLADESELAAATASIHPNMDHLVCRPRRGRAFADLDAIHLLNQTPLLNISNLMWWDQINQEARQGGASVMLTGGVGNYALSAGGEGHLVDLLREQGIISWWRVARRLAGFSVPRWRTIGSNSLGPHLPQSLYARILQATGRNGGGYDIAPILRSQFRKEMKLRLRNSHFEIRPPKDYFAYRREMLFTRNHPDKLSLARWGIDMRDPTADARLIEFCFSLPVDELTSAESARPAFDSAFSDRIPRAVLTSRFRGYQTADWHEIITKEEVATEFERYKTNSLVMALFDFKYIDHLIEKWPNAGWENRPQLYLYRNSLLNALSLANFIAVTFDEKR
jgi:asparagine synthase (glutamine-hydrolysing)